MSCNQETINGVEASSVYIGGFIPGGTENSVLYIDGSGNLAEDPTRFTYVPSTSFKTFGIQNDASSYNFGDFAVAGFGTSFSISDDEFSPVFTFQNNSLDGNIRLDSSSSGAGTNMRFTFLKNIFVPEITSTELATFNQLLVSGDSTDSYQFKIQGTGPSNFLVIDVLSGFYGMGDLGNANNGNAFSVDDASNQFAFNNNANNRVDFIATSNGTDPYFNYLSDVYATDISLTRSGTVNRTANVITSVVKTGGRTITPTRTGSFISSITDGIKTWTFTRNSDNFVTSWTVS